VTFAECSREQDVVDAVTTEQWPDRCAADLRDHVRECAGCRDLVTILAPLAESFTDARTEAPLPASGTVWWRAQLRARQEAVRAAERPIAVVHAAAGVAAAAIVLLVAVFGSPWLSSSFSASREFLTVDVASVAALTGRWLIGAAVTLLAVATLAVYLVFAQD
jgi:hypothetical protein